MKKLFTILLIGLLLTGCSKPKEAKGASLDAIKEKGTMIVGYTNYPPLGFKDPDGNETGLDLEIAKLVGKKLGVEVKFQYIDWDTKTFELNNKSIDMIWNGFTVTEERKKEVNFGKPYMDNKIVIITLKDTPINTLAELKDKDVAVETQSSGQVALEKNDVFKTIKELQKYTNVDDALLALNSKTADAVVADLTYAQYTELKSPGKYNVSEESLGSEYYAIGFRKDDDDSFRDAVDNAIDELIESKETKALSETWLGKDLIQRPWVIGLL